MGVFCTPPNEGQLALEKETIAPSEKCMTAQVFNGFAKKWHDPV